MPRDRKRERPPAGHPVRPPDIAAPQLELPVVAIVRDATRLGAPFIVTAEGIELIKRLAADGHSDTGVASILKIDRGALRDLRRRQPEVDDALAAGRAVLEHELVGVLLKAARDGQWVAALALGKTRLGWREGEARDGAAQVNVSITLPAPLTEADYRRSVAIDATATPIPPALAAATTEEDPDA